MNNIQKEIQEIVDEIKKNYLNESYTLYDEYYSFLTLNFDTTDMFELADSLETFLLCEFIFGVSNISESQEHKELVSRIKSLLNKINDIKAKNIEEIKGKITEKQYKILINNYSYLLEGRYTHEELIKIMHKKYDACKRAMNEINKLIEGE